MEKEATPRREATFKDAEGRQWHPRLTIGLARKIKDALSIDFTQVADGKLFLALGSDPFKLGATLYMLCETQAEQCGVSPESFAESLDGQAIDDALEALLAAVVLFTRAPMRGAVHNVLTKTIEAEAKAMQAVEKWAEANGAAVADEAVAAAEKALAKSGPRSSS
jgi:hypothetical protein